VNKSVGDAAPRSNLKSETLTSPRHGEKQIMVHSSVCQPAKNRTTGSLTVGDKIGVNLHHGKIEDAVVRAVARDVDGL
jgi:hypothetical protein